MLIIIMVVKYPVNTIFWKIPPKDQSCSGMKRCQVHFPGVDCRLFARLAEPTALRIHCSVVGPSRAKGKER